MPPDFARPKTSYRKLHVFRKAEAIYDLTYYFLQGHIAKTDRLNDEELCNLMLTLVNQTIAMLNKMIDKIKVDFLRNGGVKEQMFNARIQYRTTGKSLQKGC